MAKLGDVLRFAGVPERVTNPSKERFVTLRLRGGGAVERRIAQGKEPVPFTGYRLKGGQFFYSRIDARNGAFGLVPPTLAQSVVSKDFPVFDVIEDRILPSYLMHFMRSGKLEKQIIASSFGATNRQRVSESNLLNFEIILPPISEQRRVVKVLDLASSLRSNRASAIERLDALRASTFTDYFGDPESWSTSWPMGSIGDMAFSIRYGTSSKSGEIGEWPILRMGNVTDTGTLDLSDLKFADLSESEAAKYAVRRGDLLFNRTNSKEKVGKSAVVRTDRPLAIAGYLVRVRFEESAMAEYVAAYLNSAHGRSVRKRIAKVAVNQANINAKEMAAIPIAIPPLETQRKFERALEAISTKETLVRRALAEQQSLFASLQHRAFRGEL